MIKKSIKVILVALCIVALGGTNVQAEDEGPIINNGSFEKEIDKNDNQTYKAKRVDASEGKVFDGQYAMKIGAESPGIGTPGYPLWLYNGGKGMVNTVIRNIKPNTKYTIKINYFNETGVSMRLGVLDVEGYNSWQPGRLNSTYKNYQGVSANWQEASFDITTGPRATELYAFALTNWTGNVNGSGVFYVDNFRVEEVGVATPTVSQTIDYTGADQDGFPHTTPMIQKFIPTEESAETFAIDKRRQVFYSDEFSLEKTQYLAEKLVEKGIIKNYRIEMIGETMPMEGIIVTKQPISFTYPEELIKTKADAYEIDISKDTVLITSDYMEGIQNGTMTLLQAFVQRDLLPTGKVEDYTKTQMRGLQVDAGRRYYSVDWIKNEIEQMAYQKLNKLQLRLKDNEGIRYESKVAPELVDTAGGYWTQVEVKEIIEHARKFNIEVIPEIDLPGHSEQDGVNADPSWLLVPGKNILDFSNPEVRQYMADIYQEAFDLFESDIVHIGGDEYFQTPGYTDYNNKLANWAKTETGNASATAYDALKLFFNEVAKPYLDSGKTVLVWNDNIKSLNGPVILNNRIVVDFWAGTFYQSIGASSTLSAGYKAIGSPANLYHDLWPENDKLDRPLPRFLYNTWRINTYSTGYGYEQIPENLMTNSLGQMFPIWDDANGFAPEYILSKTLFPRLTIFSNTMWGADRTNTGTTKLSFEEYELLSYKIGMVNTKTYPQVKMGYTDKDVEIIVNKIKEEIDGPQIMSVQKAENLSNLRNALDAPAASQGNATKIYEIIRLYENLEYEDPVFGDINVNFEDEKGNEISEKVVMLSTDSIDGTYKVEPKEIADYTFSMVKDGSALEEGYFKKAKQDITYIYTEVEEQIVDPKPKPEENPEEKPEEKPEDKSKEKPDGKITGQVNKGTNTKTSDNTNDRLYLAIMLFSIITLLSLYRKKNKRT